MVPRNGTVKLIGRYRAFATPTPTRGPLQAPRQFEAITATVVEHFKDRPGIHDDVLDALRSQGISDEALTEIEQKLDDALEAIESLGGEDAQADGQLLADLEKHLDEADDIANRDLQTTGHETQPEPKEDEGDADQRGPVRKTLDAAVRGATFGGAKKGAEEAIDDAGGWSSIISRIMSAVEKLADYFT